MLRTETSDEPRSQLSKYNFVNDYFAAFFAEEPLVEEDFIFEAVAVLAGAFFAPEPLLLAGEDFAAVVDAFFSGAALFVAVPELLAGADFVLAAVFVDAAFGFPAVASTAAIVPPATAPVAAPDKTSPTTSFAFS